MMPFRLFILFCLHFHFLPRAFAQFCDPSSDPFCRPQAFTGQRTDSSQSPNGPCQYQARLNPKKLVELDAKQVRIHPPVIKLPGCFTVEIGKVHILENEGSRSIFAKTEFQWLNAAGSREANCQNASVDGCGGFGNNCYYCNICENLRAIDEHAERSNLPTEIAEQLKSMNCPDKAGGTYTFRKQFCFNDWSILDANKDCQLDFLDPSLGDDQNGLKAAMAALQQVGYGTVVAKVRLAFNATPEIELKKAQKEAQIERTMQKELERRKDAWDSKQGNFAEFSEWFVDQRKGKWHKDEYLPWLLYENEIACIRLTFDVCERPPQQRWDGSKGYTCI